MITLKLRNLAALACELPDEVERYQAQGDFAAAEAAIDRWLLKPVGVSLRERLSIEKEILRQLPEQFPFTVPQAIAVFRETVPDFCEADLKRLDRESLAEWIFVDGEKHYIHNLVRNVTQKDPEILRRSGLGDPDEEEKHVLGEELAFLRKQGESVWRFRIRASIHLKEELFRPGMRLRAHLPLPAELFQTSDVKILAHSNCETVIDPADALYRAIFIEAAPQENQEFFVEYEYTVRARYRNLWVELEKPGKGYDVENQQVILTEKGWKKRPEISDECGKEINICYLKEQLPHIRFTPYLRSLASEITAGAEMPLEKAARIYDYVTKNVKYSYMRNYFLIPDIPQYCARNLRGDCGVQALLFITLCRIAGIPARWQSGLYAIPEHRKTPLHAKAAVPKQQMEENDRSSGRQTARYHHDAIAEAGAHDWAMFWVKEYGWLYADPSFGGAAYADGDEERRRFYFGNLDPFRMAANNAFMQPFASPKHYLAADPCDNQSGELESDFCGYEGSEMIAEKLLLKAEPV